MLVEPADDGKMPLLRADAHSYAQNMRVPLLFLLGLFLVTAMSAEDGSRVAADAEVVPDTLAGWRAVVAAHAGAYTAIVATADERAGMTVGQRFTVVIVPDAERLGGVGFDLPTGRRICGITLGQGGNLGFADLVQKPMITGAIERHRDQTSLRMTLSIASDNDVTGYATADLTPLEQTAP